MVEDLMYIQTSVNEQPINVMLDSGVTHIFVSNQLVKDLGLRLSSNRNFMKAINPKAQKIVSMSYDVLIMLDQWRGNQDVLVVNLDDYDIILSLDFLRKAKIVLMPYLNGVIIASLKF